MIRISFFFLVFFLVLMGTFSLSGQMIVGQDTLFGNEWLNYEKQYLKIPIAEDGIYALSFETLEGSGFPVEQIQGSAWRLFAYGKEVPIRVPGVGVLAAGQSLHFYGEKNRYQLDQYFYQTIDDILNPEFSVITDTAWYFLTWDETPSPSLQWHEVPNDLTSPPPAEPLFVKSRQNVYTSTHYKSSQDGVAESVFTRGEGFGGNLLKSQTIVMDVPGLVDTDYPVQLVVHTVSNNTDHDLRVSWNGLEMHQDNYTGYDIKQIILERSALGLPVNQSITISGMASASDRAGVSIVRINYPHSFEIGSFARLSFKLPLATGNRHLVFTGVEDGSYTLYLLERGQFLKSTAASGVLAFQISAEQAVGSFVLINDLLGVITPGQNQLVSLEPVISSPISYLLISNKALMSNGGMNEITNYADYRKSNDGGNHLVAAVDVERLYDQFSYGIPRHPIAIRNFIHWLEHEGLLPEYVFLIGKGRQYHLTRTKAQLNHIENQTFYIPTWGAPGSDNLLVTKPWELSPSIPLGRLSAESPEEVRMYLNKIIEHEAGLRSTNFVDRIWRKEVVHLGGGGVQSEQQIIRNALGEIEDILRQGLIGANVTSFYKTSTDPVQYSVSKELTRKINEGSSLVTFFGHSGSGGFDFSIDDPSNYTNKGRYPVILSLGCYSGQIHEGYKSVGENFLFQEEKAAIAFFATTGLGYISSLRSMAIEFFKYQSGAEYGNSIGKIFQHTLSTLGNNPGFGNRVLLQQFTLNGDPALKVYAAQDPDYIIPKQSVEVLPAGVATTDDSLWVKIPVVNSGRNNVDSLRIRLERILPDGTASGMVEKVLVTGKFSQNLTIGIPVGNESAGGENRVRITLNPDTLIYESPLPEALENNAYYHADGIKGHPFQVLSNAAYLAWPPDYGIVGKTPYELNAYTANVFAPTQSYIIQIDTSIGFNSPIMKEKEIIQDGGAIRWTPDIPMIDSTVYFWRISPTGQGTFWRQRSFVFIPGIQGGWHQSHPAQFKENDLDNLVIEEKNDQWRFAYDVRTVRIKNGVHPLHSIGVDFDNDPHFFIVWDGPVTKGLYVFAVDPSTAWPWINQYPGLYGSHQPTPWAGGHGHFPYWTNSQEWRERAINFIRDTIPTGHYVILYTIQYENASYVPEEWAADSISIGTNLFQVLEAQGAKRIRETESLGSRPYILMFKKDDPTWIPVERLAGLEEGLDETVLLNGLWDQGDMLSRRIGPAKHWTSMSMKLENKEANDLVDISLWGIQNDGTRTLLLSEIAATNTDLSFIDPAEFPLLELTIHAEDSQKRSSPNIAFWQVIYDELPDLALDPSSLKMLPKDTLEQGEPISLQLGMRNLQIASSDSVHVRLLLQDTKGNANIFNQVYPPMLGGELVDINFEFQDALAQGEHQLGIQINPGPFQPETEYRNNNGILNLFISKDEKQPVLLVTFDGKQIAQGELVSANPTIELVLRDQQEWLRLQDTTAFEIWLKGPNNGLFVPVFHSDQTMTFTPAPPFGSGPNEARVVYKPNLTTGEYSLRAISRDQQGNRPDLNYEVRFIVEEKQELTNFWCVPNPISEIGRFYYRLTGSQPVNQYIVQIHDMTGRLIRTLNQTDLGALQPGLNVSNIWYTMQMPSGVYVFKFVDLSTGLLEVQNYHNPENIDSESGNVLFIVD